MIAATLPHQWVSDKHQIDVNQWALHWPRRMHSPSKLYVVFVLSSKLKLTAMVNQNQWVWLILTLMKNAALWRLKLISTKSFLLLTEWVCPATTLHTSIYVCICAYCLCVVVIFISLTMSFVHTWLLLWNDDKIFGVDTTQSQLFESVEGVVDSVMEGFNGTILAYGQTSSGCVSL